MEIHYLDIFSCLFLLCLLPLLKTHFWLDCIVYYFYGYATLVSKLEGFYSDCKYSLQVALEKDQNHFLAILVLFALFIKRHIDSKKITTFLSCLGVVNLFLTAVALPFNDQFVSGLIPNKAMNAILNTALLPYTHILAGWKAVVLVAFFAFMSGSSTAVLSLAGLTFAFILTSQGTKKRLYVIMLVVAAIVGGCLLVPHFFDATDRLRMWNLYFEDFGRWDYILGRGPASFPAFSVVRQRAVSTGPLNDIYFDMEMHSDPLQYLNEYGLIGFLPITITLYYIGKYAQRREILALSSFLAGSLFYYPFHFYPHLLVLFCIVKIVANSYKTRGLVTTKCRECGTLLFSSDALKRHMDKTHPEIKVEWGLR